MGERIFDYRFQIKCFKCSIVASYRRILFTHLVTIVQSSLSHISLKVVLEEQKILETTMFWSLTLMVLVLRRKWKQCENLGKHITHFIILSSFTHHFSYKQNFPKKLSKHLDFYSLPITIIQLFWKQLWFKKKLVIMAFIMYLEKKFKTVLINWRLIFDNGLETYFQNSGVLIYFQYHSLNQN